MADLTRILGDRGFAVTTSSCWGDLPDHARSDCPTVDVLVVDARHGVPSTAEIHSGPAGMGTWLPPSLYLLGGYDPGEIITAIRLRATAFLAAPFTEEALVQMVSNLGVMGRVGTERLAESVDATLARADIELREQSHAIARVITSTLDIHEVMAKLLSLSVQATAANAGSVFLLNEAEIPTHRILARPDIEPEIGETVLRSVLEKGLAGWSLRNRTIGIVWDTETDDRWTALPGGEVVARSAICVPIIRAEKILGIMTFHHGECHHFTDQHARFLTTVAAEAAIAIENANLFDQVQRQARQDYLTGIPNRRHFLESAEMIFDRCREDGSSLSAVMIDIDFFKSINDRYGHLAGDAVLKEVASRLVQSVRPGDVVGRYGGEEFCALLLGMSAEGPSRERLDLMRASIAAEPVTTEWGPIPVTASLGCSTRSAGTPSLQVLINEADTALYCAKNDGRNCFRLHGDRHRCRDAEIKDGEEP
ncbi:MAG: GGDEF domain-containing protein [Acidobacteria bacterium]|nr:GGDEF domain-containing protein [Acidobacteriota bacterium]